MLSRCSNTDEIKRKLRSLKKLEIKLRFGNSFRAENTALNLSRVELVWNKFFNIRNTGSENSTRKSRYSLEDIVSKNKQEFKDIVDEFFFNVYYVYYTENGILCSNLYNPEILKWMGLPQSAGFEEIKKKFRELAKKYHPDTGGDSSKFIELMKNYKKLGTPGQY